MTGAELWPLGAYGLVVLGLVAAILVLSALLGERHQEAATNDSYESGIVSTGSARTPLSARFYLIAVFFVIFDLEAAFLVAWAIAVEDAGWAGLVEIAVFVLVLLAALAYLWRTGALDWGTVRRLKERGLRRELSP